MATSLAQAPLNHTLAEHAGQPVKLYPRSFRKRGETWYGLVRTGPEKKLIILNGLADPFETESMLEQNGKTVHLCPPTSANADALRRLFPWTAPEPLGKTSAIGCGDRLGIASPGHIRACRETNVPPVLAQQSIREMERTERTPQEVLDDATWAVFQEGYTAGFGADADHLKTPEDIDACVEAGYTMYTIDPSDHVDNEADHLGDAALQERFEALPWNRLDTTPEEALVQYADTTFDLSESAGALQVEFDAETLKRSAVKYGAAVAHTKDMARHLARRYQEDRAGASYDLEMSVDETDYPTRPHEHYFVAAELDRLDLKLTSLAPRFPGDFEKGIDFIGDLDRFEASFQAHATIAEAFGGYKLSIHSGSDKFSAFPIIGQCAGNHVHLKTAGTSYLEALRIAARRAPDLLREIVEFAFERFGEDRKTYHVSTDLDAIPEPATVADADLEAAYLEDEDGRQLLHITYGSVLTARENGADRFCDRFYQVLNEHEEEHYDTLTSHFLDHIESVGHMSVA